MSTILMLSVIPNQPMMFPSSLIKRKNSINPYLVSCIEPRPRSMQCGAYTKPAYDRDTTIQRRRSGNYKPPLWNFGYVQSLSSQYTDDKYSKRVYELIVKVKMLMEEQTLLIEKLELIDELQRLGISYHFEDRINQILNSLYHDHHQKHAYQSNCERDLYSTALEFRLLRQQGYMVSQEVFNCFKNNKGDFKPSIGDDTKGLLQLYEASFLLMEGEETLELARQYSTNLLQKKVDNYNIEDCLDGLIDEELLSSVRHALELPLHWRIRRPNARWFIQAYQMRQDANPIVLELAKLDFNVVQAIHQQELKHVSSWWKQTCLAEKLPFARDRLVECYFWTLGGLFEPQYGYSRIMATKVNAFITIIDDIFDVYGTLEELQLLNNVIQRWDIERIDKLPRYMQICFLALNNFIDEMAYDILKEQGFIIIPYLRKSWADLCKSYLQEAKWYSRGYTPTMDEYINNAWISISAPVILSHAFFLVTSPIDKEAVQSLYEYHNLVRHSSMILRLANDLGTSPDEMKRGDVPKSIECYMNESGANREEAVDYVRFLIYDTWKKMNEQVLLVKDSSTFQQDFVRSGADLGRMAQYMYQHGDGHGIQYDEMKHRISSLLFEPFL